MPRLIMEESITKCPLCRSKMVVMESLFRLYEFNENSPIISKEINRAVGTDLICTNKNCNYHTQASHSMYGILPKQHEKLVQHQRELNEGIKYRGVIGKYDSHES